MGASEEVEQFVPPLRLQRNESHFVDHSGYDSPSPRRHPMCRPIEESDDEKDDLGHFDIDIDCNFEDDRDGDGGRDRERDRKNGHGNGDGNGYGNGDGKSYGKGSEEDMASPQCLKLGAVHSYHGDTDLDPPTTTKSETLSMDDSPVHPLWQQLSSALTMIYDPFGGGNFDALILERDWWLDEFGDTGESQYGVSGADVVRELSECEMSYRAVMEILFQSNPSLIPCKNYRELENVSAVHTRPRPRKVELEEINFVSTTLSPTAMECERGYCNVDDAEYSIQCNVDVDDTDLSTQNTSQWMADDYESSQWKRGALDVTPSMSLPYHL